MFGVDEKAVKRIVARADWLTLCAKLIVLKLAETLKIELPEPPAES